MNASFDRHFPDDAWEKYALGMLSEGECGPMEEHLLICSPCQDSLAEADEYIRVVKAALVRFRSTHMRRISLAPSSIPLP